VTQCPPPMLEAKGCGCRARRDVLHGRRRNYVCGLQPREQPGMLPGRITSAAGALFSDLFQLEGRPQPHRGRPLSQHPAPPADCACNGCSGPSSSGACVDGPHLAGFDDGGPARVGCMWPIRVSLSLPLQYSAPALPGYVTLRRRA
jgi:hypothetical protein